METGISLKQYAQHKRATLDRITYKYAYLLDKISVEFASSKIDEMVRSLNSGFRSYKPVFSDKEDIAFENTFKKHRKDALFVAFADAISEVPEDDEGKLSQFINYPINFPVENTLTELQKKKANSLTDFLEKKLEKDRPKTFFDLKRIAKRDLLRNIKKAYRSASKSWIAGESSIVEVKKVLTHSLLRNKNSIDRIFRTETTSYFNEGRVEYFNQVKTVTHYEIVTITDGRQSAICETRTGYVFVKAKAKMKKYRPPFHPNCRTILVPLMIFLKRHQKKIEKGMKMDERKFAPLPKGWAA